jgi:hypothetical protein
LMEDFGSFLHAEPLKDLYRPIQTELEGP